MRIFLFLIPLLFIWGCSTIEVTKEVIKVTNALSNKVKDSVPQKETDEQKVLKRIIEEKEMEEEIEIIQEKKEVMKRMKSDSKIDFVDLIIEMKKKQRRKVNGNTKSN